MDPFAIAIAAGAAYLLFRRRWGILATVAAAALAGLALRLAMP
jgi:hypothetical protein